MANEIGACYRSANKTDDESMLFNSAPFLFLFLPITLMGYALAIRWRRSAANLWLLTASIFFYGVWDYRFLPVLLISIGANYLIGLILIGQSPWRKAVLGLGIAVNLAALGYFKYVNFFVDTANQLGASITWPTIILPLGISFFTFQNIAYLVDTYRRETAERDFFRYSLFVAFFPQLIAGPIVHQKEVLPQFERGQGITLNNLTIGTVFLVAGLTKKVIFADSFAVPASTIFDASAAGAQFTLIDAWLGSLAYTLQIYFDFSGYSDMAMGLARMFGIDLPINFASPYKAKNISDFWRRWHITLSRFLRDYLYIPLGGSRVGEARTSVNLALTMVLGGIWHGAGWTFLVWGAMHGTFLLVHHQWRKTSIGRQLSKVAWWAPIAWILTFTAVVFSWVPFRAANMESTLSLWRAMVGISAVDPSDLIRGPDVLPILTLGALLAVAAPNLYEIFAKYRVGLPSPGYPATAVTPVRYAMPAISTPLGVVAGIAFAFVILKLSDISEFLYFQF